MRKRLFFIVIMTLSITACVKRPPADVDNVCHIFKQYPGWYRDAKEVERRWLVPVPVQMAIIHQESKFDGQAKPPASLFLGIIPVGRPSSAYGYTQALSQTWSDYKRNNGNILSTRDNFSSAVDFIGWYVNQAHKKAGISREDTYHLYLAYHEGIGGYTHQTYKRKNWLVNVAHKVRARAEIYRHQLATCRRRG